MNNTLPNYDATFCGKLPLHQTNLIQPHGFLFVMDAATLEVLQVSDNISGLVGQGATDLVGKPFGALLDSATLESLQQLLQQTPVVKQPLGMGVLGENGVQNCSALMHQKDGLLFIELIDPALADGKGRSFLDVYQDLRNLVHDMGTCDDISSFAAVVARELRRISGFDKVMVYSFDADWHGTVIGEEKEAGMDAYLGLRFPASDIPRPARELYLKNPYRYIPDSRYQPVRLYPLLNPLTHALTDLSGCDLRSVAGVHLEYLKNMGVGASLSLRLVHNGQLWGLISCHHRTARFFSFEEMGVFELLSDLVSAQLSILLNKLGGAKYQGLQDRLTKLVPVLHDADNLNQTMESRAEDIRELLGASGIAYNVNGHIHAAGAVPDANDLHRLFYWLQVQSPQSLVHKPSLPAVFEEAADFAAVGSGMLALPVVPERGQFVVAFRPEFIEEVAWGGNPHEALQLEADGKTYHPRHSFSVWKQTVQHTAKPWSTEELAIAEAFRNVLTSVALRRMHH